MTPCGVMSPMQLRERTLSHGFLRREPPENIQGVSVSWLTSNRAFVHDKDGVLCSLSEGDGA